MMVMVMVNDDGDGDGDSDPAKYQFFLLGGSCQAEVGRSWQIWQLATVFVLATLAFLSSSWHNPMVIMVQEYIQQNNLFIHIQITQCCIELCNILCNLKPLVGLHLIFTNFIIFTRQNPTTSLDVLVAFAKLTQDQWQGQSRTQWAHLLQVDFPNCDWWLRCRLHTMPPTVLPNLGCSLFKWELHGLTCTRPHQPCCNVLGGSNISLQFFLTPQDIQCFLNSQVCILQNPSLYITFWLFPNETPVVKWPTVTSSSLMVLFFLFEFDPDENMVCEAKKDSDCRRRQFDTFTMIE